MESNELIEARKIYLAEIKSSLQSINNFVQDAVNSETKLFRENIILAIFHQIGYLTSLFNQLINIEPYDVDDENKKIGF